MNTLLKELCQPDFEVETVVSIRCKRLLDGKCCWTAHYRLQYGNIQTKSTFSAAVNRIAADKPYRSKVVAYGRYGSSDYGLFISYANKLCTCIQDFDYDLTPFPMLGE